jgi:hypothetical protein
MLFHSNFYYLKMKLYNLSINQFLI